MGVGVILAGSIVPVLRDWLVRSKLLKPGIVILVQAGFVVVDENGGGDMHGNHQYFTILTSCLLEL